MHMYFILTRIVEILHKINSSVCILLLDICTSYPQSLLLAYLMSKEELKRKKNYRLPYLYLSFHIIIFSISDQLLNGSNASKKGYNKAPWSFIHVS